MLLLDGCIHLPPLQVCAAYSAPVSAPEASQSNGYIACSENLIPSTLLPLLLPPHVYVRLLAARLLCCGQRRPSACFNQCGLWHRV
jgi:hypothetical protein